VLCSSEAVGKLSVSLALMAVVFKLLCYLLNVSLASLCKNLPPKSKWHPKSKVKVNVLNGSGLKFRSVERRQVIVIRSWVALWKNESSTHGVALNSILRTCGFFFFFLPQQRALWECRPVKTKGLLESHTPRFKVSASMYASGGTTVSQSGNPRAVPTGTCGS
jgi:hypothetical protein